MDYPLTHARRLLPASLSIGGLGAPLVDLVLAASRLGHGAQLKVSIQMAAEAAAGWHAYLDDRLACPFLGALHRREVGVAAR